ncbi:hypothetical protein J3R82DRAFT_10942 [Butyriboletus roseoflavus]|nr:hypothetical protein J3R82DRAFT_10942 [Butyriboletus roseoflavus]
MVDSVTNKLDLAGGGSSLGSEIDDPPLMNFSPPRILFRSSTYRQGLPSPSRTPCFAFLHGCDGGHAHKTSAGFRMCFPGVLNPLSLNSLQARDDGTEQGGWGPLQIATPVIVGGALLLVFVAYIIWQRNPHKRSYDYHPVRSDWVNKIERMFVPRRMRLRVLHSSAPMTLDDSMHTASLRFDFRRAPYRSGSSDSQTPLTTTNYTFDYPPNKIRLDSPPSIAKRRVRWWRFFGSRPKEVKSQEPGSRWRVDGPDGSSSGHGNSSHGHEEYHTRYTGVLEAVQEDRGEVGDVIPIGENLASIASTPMTSHFPEQARVVQGMSTVPELPGSSASGSGTPLPAASALQSRVGTPQSSATRGLPPTYDVSQSQTRYAFTEEDIVRLIHSETPCMVIPPPVRTAGYTSLPVFHGRQFSSDSFLAAQPPLVPAASIY